MKIRHRDIVIDSKAPFSNCKLGREKHAEILTKIIASSSDSFVLALNNEWGTGKTTFVKMWQRYLDLKEYKTLYFNSWENDFVTDPLVAIMAELNTLTKSNTTDTFKSIVSKGAILTKNILPHLVKELTKKYTGIENLSTLTEDATSGIAEILTNEIEEYSKKKENLKEFRSKLEKFIKESNEGKPIIFIIDELDRCRPSYAVEVLEQVKHLFSVQGIIFILSIDKTQLGHAIKGVYGNDQINANEYLRRFIDIEYSIPQPNTEDFCSYLYEYFEFDTFFNKPERIKYREFISDKDYLISISSTLFEKSSTTLRQQEKIFSHTRLVINFFLINNFIFPELLITLIFIRNFHNDLYIKIRLKQLDIQSLINDFFSIVPKGIEKRKIKDFIFIEATLAFMYNNSFYNNDFKPLIENNTDGIKCFVTSRLDDTINSEIFTACLKSLHNDRSYGRIGVEYLLEKIDLTGDIKI